MATPIIGARAAAPVPNAVSTHAEEPVKHTIGNRECDFYNGSKAALVSAGIAKDGEFPGDPGRGRTSVTIRGEQEREKGERLHDIPGYRRIRRSGDGFIINVTVDRDTQKARGFRKPPEERREAEHKAFDEEQTEAATSKRALARNPAPVNLFALFNVGDRVVACTPNGENCGTAQ